jgi:[acyl-carrier-protein] S-malonyltransferase
MTAVQSLCAALETDGFRSVLLPVSAPFHSPLMAPARDAMAPLLHATKLADTPAGMIPNCTGKRTDKYSIDLLIEQIDHPVMWIQTLESAHAEHCTRFVEVGPGKVLMGLTRRVLPRGVELVTTDEPQDGIAKVKAWS